MQTIISISNKPLENNLNDSQQVIALKKNEYGHL